MKDNNISSGFKIPDGYMDNLGERLMQQASQADGAMPKSDGFSVPQGYFEGLGERLRKKVFPQQTKVIQLNPKRSYWSVAAAAAVVIALASTIYLGNRTDAIDFDGLAVSDMENYMVNEVELSTEELAQMHPIDEAEFQTLLSGLIEENQITSYLDATIEDIEELNYGYEE